MQIKTDLLSAPLADSQVGQAPLVAHIIFSLHVGGLENGLVNLINHIPHSRFRHTIICLTDYSEFRSRIRRDDVAVWALNKPPGKGLMTYLKLWRLLRRLQPDIVHTRNLAALECQLPAALAGVPIRIHSEHGRDVGDFDGSNRKNQWLRRLYRPLVDRYIPLSRDLEVYLRGKINITPHKIAQIYNGVDSELFHPPQMGREPLPYPDFTDPELFIIGTVGRMQVVKDQLTLVRAFILLLKMQAGATRQLRLVMVGDGPLREKASLLLEQAGVRDLAWLPGARDDVPRIMRGLDLFVLPSLAEGISNTILEAMASGLAVVATRIGGNPELVRDGYTGQLVPPADALAMANAMCSYFNDREQCKRHGRAARERVEQCFSMASMVNGYLSVYDQMLSTKQRIRGKNPTNGDN